MFRKEHARFRSISNTVCFPMGRKGIEMTWTICFFTAIAMLALSGVFFVAAKREKRSNPLVRPINILFVGVVLASVIVFIPIYTAHKHKGGFLVTLLLSLHNMLRLFVIDGELTFMIDAMEGVPNWLFYPYSVLAALLYTAAPMITFGFVLSFYKNAYAVRKFLQGYNKELYVFSDLNEKSVTLAESLYANHPQSLYVFCNVNADKNDALSERTKQLNAVCFTKDVAALKLNVHSTDSHTYIFQIGDDEAENVDRAYTIIQKYGNRTMTDMYVFSSQPKAEALLSHFSEEGMRLHRVSEVRSFLYHELYDNGICLFRDAVPVDGIRQIGAIVVGLSPNGFEVARTLPWFCQMDGYQIRIHVFDRDPEAKGRMCAACPELMDDAHNGQFEDDGEAQYEITVEGGMDYESDRFLQRIRDVGLITYTFIDTGDDTENIRIAMRLRVLYERMHIHPRIIAILRNSRDKDMLNHVCDYSGNAYDILFAGDIRTCYTESVILNSELEKEALRRHMKWGEEKAFWTYEHNYRSSMASAIHTKMKRLCKLPGSDLEPSKRSEPDKLRYRKLEHRRWNAYMRSEGFVYSGSTEKSSRNNLGKMHNCLVTFDMLTEAEKIKDDD